MKQAQLQPIIWKDARALLKLNEKYGKERCGRVLEEINSFRDKLVDRELEAKYPQLLVYQRQEVKREAAEEINGLFLSGKVITEEGNLDKVAKPVFSTVLFSAIALAYLAFIAFLADTLAKSISGKGFISELEKFPVVDRIIFFIGIAAGTAKLFYDLHYKAENESLAGSVCKIIADNVAEALE